MLPLLWLSGRMMRLICANWFNGDRLRIISPSLGLRMLKSWHTRILLSKETGLLQSLWWVPASSPLLLLKMKV